MRHRSRTNARNLENLQLRREYLDRNSWCELRQHFKHQFRQSDAVEVHHLFSARQRPDLLSNLLSVSREAHEWCEQNKTAGRVAALWVKHAKSELDPVEFRLASGRILSGWLAITETDVEWLIEPLAKLRAAYPCD